MSPEPEPARPRRRAPLVGLVLAGLALGCLGAGALLALEDPIATAIARERLAARGVRCDERFALDVSLTLERATIGATSCQLQQGPIESIDVVEPITVDLGADLRPSRVRGGRLRAGLRGEPPSPPAPGWGAVLEALSIPARLGVLVAAVAGLARHDPPALALDAVEIVQAGRPIATLSELHLSRPAPATLALRAARIDLLAIEGPLGVGAEAAIAALETTATPSTVELAGDLDVRARAPLLGSSQTTLRLSVRAANLDGPSPTYTVDLGGSP